MRQPRDRAGTRLASVNVGKERLTLAYSAWGAGRPVLLLHGMGSWRRIWAPFDVKGYRFYALDLPGFGESGMMRRRQDLADYSAAVAGFYEAVGPSRPPLLVGHSFGAMVAVHAARAHLPAAALLLVAPAGLMNPRGALQPTPLVAVNRLLIWVTGMEWFGRQMARALGLDPNTLDHEARRALQTGWRRAREMARMGRFYEYPGMRDDLLHTGVPHRILAGTRDTLFPASSLAGVLAGLDVDWLEGFGHIPMLQDPGLFERAFRRTLTALYPPDPGDAPA